jgi:hypothetical protein
MSTASGVPAPGQHPPQDLSILSLDEQRALRAALPVAYLTEAGYSRREAARLLFLTWLDCRHPAAVR